MTDSNDQVAARGPSRERSVGYEPADDGLGVVWVDHYKNHNWTPECTPAEGFGDGDDPGCEPIVADSAPEGWLRG